MFQNSKQQQFTKNGEILESADYKIYLSQQIGKGAFGKVFQCERKNFNTQEQLCAKIVDVSSIDTEFHTIQRELDIINVLGTENNENLVKTYYRGFQDNNSKLFIIMERCSYNLKEVFEQKKQHSEKYTENEIQDMIFQIIAGYSSLYKHNIIHRDLKPENILIKEANGKKIYKIADFGAAKKSEINVHQTKIGTPIYSAPEFNPIIQNDQQLKQRTEQMQKDKKIKNCLSQADVYSLGIIAYEIYYSKLPFPSVDYVGIQEFFSQLKQGKFLLPQDFSRQSQNIQVMLIQQAIKYYPDERITFDTISSYYNKKFNKNQQQFNNFQMQPPIPTNQQNAQQQQQNSQNQFFPNNNQQQQKIFSNPQAQPQNQANNFRSPHQTFQKQPPPFGQFQPQQVPEQKPQQTRNANFQQAPFPFNTNKPILNFNQYASSYLEQQINQNQYFFSKETLDNFENLRQLIWNKDIDSLKNKKADLLKMFIFNEKSNYSLNYLQFYFILLSFLKNSQESIDEQVFNQDNELRQKIIQLQKQQ